MAVAYRTKMTISPTQNGRDNAIMLKSDHFLKDLSPKHLRYQNYNKKKWVSMVKFWNLYDHVNGIYSVTKPSTRHKNPITNRKALRGLKIATREIQIHSAFVAAVAFVLCFCTIPCLVSFSAIIRGCRRKKLKKKPSWEISNFSTSRLKKVFNLRQISIWCLALFKWVSVIADSHTWDLEFDALRCESWIEFQTISSCVMIPSQ